jgi:predicted nucleic acid-binding protein
MSQKKLRHLLIDTSSLFKAGDDFGNGDFRKLLNFSKAGELKIYIPYIVWEERRTQLVATAHMKLRKLDEAFKSIDGQRTSNFMFDGLSQPVLSIFNASEVESNSKAVMAAFATEHKIEIVPLAPDHADRAWQRYFDVGLPFNPDQKREDRRKDIPDSWIFETAKDLKNKHPELLALCDDGKLKTAFESIEIRIFKEAQQVVDELEELDVQVQVAQLPIAKQAPETVGSLDAALSDAQRQFKEFDAKILGYIAYLESTSKAQLFGLLSQSGISIDVAENVCDRLTMSGLVTDTGNNYLSKKSAASELAAASIEPEIIRLLAGGHNGV